MDQLRALVRVTHGAPLFALFMFVFGLLWGLVDDVRVWVDVVSALVASVVGGAVWFAVMRSRARRRPADGAGS